MRHGVGYLAALVTMVTADTVWLSLMAPRIYKPTLGDIMLSGFNLRPAILFYLLYPVGLVIFTISPAVKSGSLGTGLLYGALFGFFTYATYDLTNQATLRNWTVQLTILDVAWGTVLAAVASGVSVWMVTKFVGAS
jgi:uncharacterized membrane protein